MHLSPPSIIDVKLLLLVEIKLLPIHSILSSNLFGRLADEIEIIYYNVYRESVSPNRGGINDEQKEMAHHYQCDSKYCFIN